MSQSWKEVKGCAEVTMGPTDVKDIEQGRRRPGGTQRCWTK